MSTLIDCNMNRNEIRYHIRTLLSAGHDTTAYLGSYMVYLLSHNQDIQDKVRYEINNIINGDQISIDDISKLKYCKNVIHEVLRLYTIIPFVSRTCTKNYKIENSNLIIPKDTDVLIPLTIMNRSGKYWENPNQFNPDRFDYINSSGLLKSGYFPFGYGSRTCIGNNLAINEMIIIMVKLIKNFRLIPDIKFKPNIIAGISLISDNGILVYLNKI